MYHSLEVSVLVIKVICVDIILSTIGPCPPGWPPIWSLARFSRTFPANWCDFFVGSLFASATGFLQLAFPLTACVALLELSTRREDGFAVTLGTYFSRRNVVHNVPSIICIQILRPSTIQKSRGIMICKICPFKEMSEWGRGRAHERCLEVAYVHI